MGGIKKYATSVVTVMAFVAGSVAVSGAVEAQTVGPPAPSKIVQLGDSYSAGNGARAADGDRNYVGVSKCYRSPTNWGSQYANTLRDDYAVTYVNRACSGGVIGDVLNDRNISSKTVGQLVGCPSAEFPDEEYWVREDGLPFDKCQRYLRPQIEAIDASVDLVLMTGGGNDAEFATVVERCFATGRRNPGDCRAAVNNAQDQLGAIQTRLVNNFAEIRAKAPEAKIVFVAYPHLVPDVDYELRSLRRTDTYAAGNEIRQLGLDGDAGQATAIELANEAAGDDFVVYIDSIKDIFEGHLPNPDQSAPRNPNRWIYEFETRIKEEWYHYRPEGHAAIAAELASFGDFGVRTGPVGAAPSSDIDVAFVVDATGSMRDEIAEVRRDLSLFVDQLEASANSFRVAVVSYKDFPEAGGSFSDYPARVDLGFSSDVDDIQLAIDGLRASGGGDFAETVFSGLDAAYSLSWRPGVTKIAIVIGDAPPKSPEPVSGLTADDIIQASLALDPVQVIGLDVDRLDSTGVMQTLAAGTGGSVRTDGSGLSETITDILGTAVLQPFAWMGVAYAGSPGEPLTFDGSGSYDPAGRAISSYEWDFDGDGVFDAETTTPEVTHTYDEAFEGYAVLRVTGEGGTALGSARVVINDEGSAPQGIVADCELDEDGFPSFVDEFGDEVSCEIESLPEESEGIVVTSSFGVAVVEPARLLDTRPTGETVDGIGVGGFAVQAGEFREVQITSRGGVPDGAAAALLNLTAIRGGENGFATMYPCDAERPGVSSLNYSAGVNIANASVVPLSATGTVCVYSSARAHYAIDVTGYVDSNVDVGVVEPARLLDTRPTGVTTDGEFAGGFAIQAGEFREVQITSRGGVPDGAAAALLNLTAIRGGENGFATMYPCDAERPGVSSLNYSAGVNIANASVVPLSATGTVCVYSSARAHYAIDVTGFVDAGFDVGVVEPARLLDTRPTGVTVDAVGAGGLAVRAGEFREVQITSRGGVPDGVSAALVNLTAIRGGENGFATLYPCDVDRPTVSTLNYSAGVNIANASVVALSATGTICVYSSARAQFAMDITGYVP